MKRFSLFVAFLLCAFVAMSQSSDDDGYVIGFDKSDSVYMDFQVLRPEFNEWHKIGTILNELYGLEAKELSEATVIVDKKFKTYEGWKNVAEIDLANPQTTIASGKDKYVIQVRYRKGGAEDFADQSSTITANVILISVETAADGVGQKIATVCYPSSKYESEVAGDLSAERIFSLSLHEYPIFVNIHGIPKAFDAAKDLHSFDIHWDAVYMNRAIYGYFSKKGASLTASEKSMLVKSAYNLGRCYCKVGMYHKALQYLAYASRNSAGEKHDFACRFSFADCLSKLKQDNSEVYDQVILAYQDNPKMEARDLDFVMRAYIERGKIYMAQKNAEKAKECFLKETAMDTGKRYAAVVAELTEKVNKMN